MAVQCKIEICLLGHSVISTAATIAHAAYDRVSSFSEQFGADGFLVLLCNT